MLQEVTVAKHWEHRCYLLLNANNAYRASFHGRLHAKKYNYVSKSRYESPRHLLHSVHHGLNRRTDQDSGVSGQTRVSSSYRIDRDGALGP